MLWFVQVVQPQLASKEKSAIRFSVGIYIVYRQTSWPIRSLEKSGNGWRAGDGGARMRNDKEDEQFLNFTLEYKVNNTGDKTI